MNSRLLLILAFFLSLPLLSKGQDSTATRKWYVPDGVTLQFAGNTGMFALGPSYSFGKDKLNTELLYGFVPRFDAEETLHLLTLKGIYKPIRPIRLSDALKLTPLRLHLGVSYYFRDQFPTSWGSDYPNGYYWWNPSLRATGGLGAELHLPISKSSYIKELSLYGEVGTYDLIVTSAVKDPTLSAWDVLSFSMGIRAGF